MAKFRVENSIVELGVYDADSKEEALDLYAVDSGFESHAAFQAWAIAQIEDGQPGLVTNALATRVRDELTAVEID